MYDVIIVGAGPAGCRTAELLSKGGKRVLVIEEHSQVGEPVQCTGLVSGKLLKLHPKLPRDIILNRFRSARFFAPNGTSFSLSVKEPVLVIDRKKFDRWLCLRARQAGAEFKLKTRFVSFYIEKNKISAKTNRGTFETRILIGADGPLSKIREQMKLNFNYHQQIFAQKTKTGKFKDIELHFGGEYFNWVVPVSKTRARIGGPAKEQKSGGDSGGVCRYGLLKTAQKGNIFLVGDAALQVKPFSCGGIIYGQIGAQCLAKSILQNRSYDELWKKELKWPIQKGLLLCRFYRLPDWLKNVLFEIVERTCSESLLESLDVDFY